MVTTVIEQYQNLGSIYSLGVMDGLLTVLGNPEMDVPIIHVAGTNGKGSIISYLAQSYIAACVDVMTFTSPRVKEHLDQFSFNGKSVSQENYDIAAEKVLQAADKIETLYDRHATVFEMEMAVAFVLAKQLQVNIFILETGMGGRLDASNVIKKPIATVYSQIGLDHVQQLGDNLTKISREKAAIIKKGVPAFSTVQEEEVAMVLREQAAKMGTSVLSLTSQDISLLSKKEGVQSFSFNNHIYSIRMRGLHQIYNAATAVLVLSNLPKPFCLDSVTIAEGLINTCWSGSFEQISTQPLIFLDGAHNPDSAFGLAQNLKQLNLKGKYYGILHIFKDKDVPNILQKFSGIFDTLWLPQLKFKRSLDAKELQILCQQYLPNTKTIVVQGMDEATKQAKEAAKQEDLIVAFGSLSHLEMARQLLVDK